MVQAPSGVHGAWPKAMVQNSTSREIMNTRDLATLPSQSFLIFFALRVVKKVSRFEETPNFADMKYWKWQRGVGGGGSKSREFCGHT